MTCAKLNNFFLYSYLDTTRDANENNASELFVSLCSVRLRDSHLGKSCSRGLHEMSRAGEGRGTVGRRADY